MWTSGWPVSWGWRRSGVIERSDPLSAAGKPLWSGDLRGRASVNVERYRQRPGNRRDVAKTVLNPAPDVSRFSWFLRPWRFLRWESGYGAIYQSGKFTRGDNDFVWGFWPDRCGVGCGNCRPAVFIGILRVARHANSTALCYHSRDFDHRSGILQRSAPAAATRHRSWMGSGRPYSLLRSLSLD